MSQRIWKYDLPLSPRQIVVGMPAGAKILSAQNQDGAIQLWAMVDPLAGAQERRFQIVGTGGEAPRGSYLATVQQGSFVWHIFEM